MRTLISNATIVNEGVSVTGHIVIDGDTLSQVSFDSDTPHGSYDRRIDAMGCVVMPGVIDTHVHFREPGLTQKADIASESRAAAFGGVTTFFDMPNTVPQTVTLEALDEKNRLAAVKSHVNYAFFFGATNDNTALLDRLDPHLVPGIKLFMGSSTGNMLVDSDEALRRLFAQATLPIMAHCEDTALINGAMADIMSRYGDDPSVTFHPQVRSAEACYASTSHAVALAREYGARLHVAHVSTQRELELFEPYDGNGALPLVTAEAVIAHLLFTDADYATLGTRIKCNPAVKTAADRDALRHALTDGTVLTVATDHAPHRISDKEGGCRRAASGMPMVQFSLPAMLGLVDEGILSLPRLVQLMCHNPAILFGVSKRGFLRQGYKADLVVVRPHVAWTVTPSVIQSKCGWSPLEGRCFDWRVEHTFCNGHHVLDDGRFDDTSRGEQVLFRC